MTQLGSFSVGWKAVHVRRVDCDFDTSYAHGVVY